MSRFGIIPTHWMAHDSLTSSDKLVLAALSTYADSDGFCWPSVRAISDRSSLSERSVQYSLRNLEVAGAIHIERRSTNAGANTSNGFWITGYDFAPGRVQTLREGGADIAPGRVQQVHPNNTTVNRPSEDSATTATAGAPSLTFSHPEAHAAYLGYRRAARLPAAFDAALRAVMDGMTTGEPVAETAVGAALVDMAGNGDTFNTARLRGCIRLQQRAQETTRTGQRPGAGRFNPVLSEDELKQTMAELDREAV